MSEDWIKHAGGDSPVHPETAVFVRYRGPADPAKGLRMPEGPHRAVRYHWSHDGGADDIVGYRIFLSAVERGFAN
jgi:hypothetical protein